MAADTLCVCPMATWLWVCRSVIIIPIMDDRSVDGSPGWQCHPGATVAHACTHRYTSYFNFKSLSLDF